MIRHEKNPSKKRKHRFKLAKKIYSMELDVISRLIHVQKNDIIKKAIYEKDVILFTDELHRKILEVILAKDPPER